MATTTSSMMSLLYGSALQQQQQQQQQQPKTQLHPCQQLHIELHAKMATPKPPPVAASRPLPNYESVSNTAHAKTICKYYAVDFSGSMRIFARNPERLVFKGTSKDNLDPHVKLILLSCEVVNYQNTSPVPISMHIDGIPINNESICNDGCPAATVVVPPHTISPVQVNQHVYTRRDDLDPVLLDSFSGYDMAKLNAEIIRKEKGVWIIAHSPESPSSLVTVAIVSRLVQEGVSIIATVDPNTNMPVVFLDGEIAQICYDNIVASLNSLPFVDPSAFRVKAFRKDDKPWDDLCDYKGAHEIGTHVCEYVHVSALIKNTYLVYKQTPAMGPCDVEEDDN